MANPIREPGEHEAYPRRLGGSSVALTYLAHSRRLIVEKPLLLPEDRIAIGFAASLESVSLPYVIVAGYLAILLGRPRRSDDIDFLIPRISLGEFERLVTNALQRGFEVMQLPHPTPRGLEKLYEAYLEQGFSIRFMQQDTPVPNVELKFAVSTLHHYALANPVEVLLNARWRLRVSPLEMQIAYKLKLGSDKDIGDAVFLYTLLENQLDHQELKKWCTTLKADCQLLEKVAQE